MQRLARIDVDTLTLPPGTIRAYGFAFLCATAATVLRIAIDPYVEGVQYITFFPAVIITALIGGFGAGIFCVVLSAAAVNFFVIPPRLSFYLDNPAEMLALLLFLAATLSTVFLIARMRFAEHRVEERSAELRESEHQLRTVTDNAPVAIARCDMDGRYTFVNRQFAEQQGLTPGQITGKRLPDVIGGKAFAIVEPNLRKCLAGKAVEFEMEAPGRAGEPQVMRCCYKPEWRNARVVGAVAAISDITDLRRAEQRLRASEVTFRQLVDNSPFGIFAADADFRLTRMSAGAQTAFKSVQPLIGHDLAEATRFLWAEPFASDAIARFRHTLDTGESYRAPCSVQQRRETGAVETYDWKTERVTMPDGRFGLVCHFYDLTERQKHETALRESEAMFRAMFDVSSVGKVELEPETGRFLRANAAMSRFVGYSEAELLGRTVFDITHPDECDRDRELLRRLVGGESAGFDVEGRCIRKDGKAVWARVTVNVVRDGAGRPLRNIAVVQDIDARKLAEQALQASKDRLQLALGAARLGWWKYDPLRCVISGDVRFNEICDVAAGEMPLREIIGRVHPDDAERVRAAIAAALDPADPRPHATEFRLLQGHGDVRWVEVYGLTQFEGAGRRRRAVSAVGIIQDITERRQREEKEHLLMREINHRAKNMLSVVHAIAHQTATKDPDDFIKRFSERIQALSANQDLLVRNEWRGVEIGNLVRAQLAHFVDLIGSRIAVSGPELRLNAAAAQALGLALHELATNAGKYGALSLDTGRVDVDWRIDGDIFAMRWTERDGPPVSPPERQGFGSTVITSMAKRTVDGEVKLDYAPSGLVWRLTCPAANALEPWERG